MSTRGLHLILAGAFAWIVVSAARAAPQDAAQDLGSIRATAEALLGQRHPADTPEVWRSLGAAAPGVLIQMYQETTSTFYRMRLLQALTWFQDPVATQFVELQATETTESVLRAEAIRALADARGSTEVEFLAKFLSSPDPHSRVAAALSLQRMSDPRALGLYAEYLKGEKVSWAKSEAAGLSKAGALSAARGPASVSDFLGKWSGFWVSSQEGLQARFILSSSGGELMLADPGSGNVTQSKIETFQIKGPLVKQGKLTGTLKGPPASRFEAGLPFDAELVGSDVLVLRIPGIGVALSVRRTGR